MTTTRSTGRTTIVGVDGSPGARRALQWAGEDSRAHGGDVLAVHVLTYDHELMTDLSLDGMKAWRRDLERELAGPWVEPARASGASVRTRFVEDDSTSAGLLAVADKEAADLIVLGASGHGRLTDRLLSATTYKVAHRAHVPVVIIPPDFEPEVE
jgi:nucleotide-binding universal stress UspA family protein